LIHTHILAWISKNKNAHQTHTITLRLIEDKHIEKIRITNLKTRNRHNENMNTKNTKTQYRKTKNICIEDTMTKDITKIENIVTLKT